MSAILFALYTLLSGAQQGIIIFLLREFVPPRYGIYINAAFHAGGALIYGLLVSYAAHVTHAPLWPTVAIAVLLRIALFDPAVNLARSWVAHREGRAWEPVFAVGFSALFDRALRRVANALALNPSALSAAVRVSALGAIAGLLW